MGNAERWTSLLNRKTFREEFSKKSGYRMTRLDVLLVVAVMLAYSLIAFVNLGTLNFPETIWTGEYGETLTVDLGKQTELSKVVFNGAIATGTVQVYDDDDHYVEFEQINGDMYRWQTLEVSMTTRFARVFVTKGPVAFNELAFYDANGDLIKAAVYQPEGTQKHALDEQETVVEQSYLNRMYFDEIYHARTGFELVTDTKLYFDRPADAEDFSYISENGYSIYEWTHPQLGKLLIALGISIFGMNPFGWRFMGTLFGVFILAVLYVLAKRIFRRSDFAFLTSALFAVDCMHFTQTRIATIDVYALFFTLLMLLFLYDYMIADKEGASFPKQLLPLGLSGVCFGLGASSKWTCIYTGAGLAVLFFVTFACRCFRTFKVRREEKRKGIRRPAPVNWPALLPVLYGLFMIAYYFVKKEYYGDWYNLLFDRIFYIPFFAFVGIAIVSGILFRLWTRKKSNLDLSVHERWMTLVWCCVFFIVVPVVLYYLSSYCYYITKNCTTFYDRVAELWKTQINMYNYHNDLDATHLCQSMWYQWPLAQKSVWFYSGNTGNWISNISSTGNPAIWYVSAFGAVFMAVEWCLNPKCRKDSAFFLVLMGILSGLLPWTLVTRCVFLYHYFSTIPFMMLATILLFYYMEEKHPRIKPLKWAWLIVAAVVFLLMYPAISGMPCSKAYAGFIEHVLTFFGKVYYVAV